MMTYRQVDGWMYRYIDGGSVIGIGSRDMEAERCHHLPSASRRTREASGGISVSAQRPEAQGDTSESPNLSLKA